MLPERRMFEDEACPVSVDVLGEMYRANPHALNELIVSVPPAVRAMLAMYCYRRAHLASISLAIAATCDEDDLAHYGGNAGALLFAKSRERESGPRAATHPVGRRKVTLASGTLRNMMPTEDNEQEDATDAAMPVVAAAD